MKKRFFCMIAASAMVTQFALIAAETSSGLNWLTLGNRLRVEYDDNVYETTKDKTDSFKIIEEIELGITLNFNPTFISLRYRPSFTWWSDREPDDTDLHHDFDVVINHRFSPKVSVGVKNTLRLAEIPEAIDRGVTIRENDDYLYNVTDANIDYMLLPRTHAVIGGRYTILRYDQDDVAETEDYDIWAAGITLRHKLSELTQLMLDYRRESISYDAGDRDSDSDYVGLGIEHALGASFVGNLRGGYQRKDFESTALDSESSPYVDATITYIHSPRTRLSLGGGFSMFESDVYPFASQDRTLLFASLAHDLTAKISVYLTGSHQRSEYSGETALPTDVGVPKSFSGKEYINQGGLRFAYRVNSRNSLELNYQYIDLESDLRDDFDRNRVSLGWRLDI